MPRQCDRVLHSFEIKQSWMARNNDERRSLDGLDHAYRVVRWRIDEDPFYVILLGLLDNVRNVALNDL